MTKSLNDIFKTFTKEMFEVGSENMPNMMVTGRFVEGEFVKHPVGVKEEYIDMINALQLIKMAPEFLTKFGEKICLQINVIGDHIYTSIEYSPVRYQDQNGYFYYNESRKAIEDIPCEFDPEVLSVGNIQANIVHNLLNELNPSLLRILRENISSEIITNEKWQAAETLLQKYHNLNEIGKNFHTSHDTEKFSSNVGLPNMLIEAASKIDNLVEDGDIVIFVGNTPQMIRYPFDRITFETKPSLLTTSLAISGHPGMKMDGRSFASSLKNFLSDEQHELYKEYMQEMGLTKENLQNKKVNFVDCVGLGRGISYQMECLTEIAYNGNSAEAQKHFHVISTNNSKGGGALVGSKFISRNFITKTTSLDMDRLTDILDRVSDDREEMRLMPSSKSYKWSKDFMAELSDASRNIFSNTNFEDLFAQIDKIKPGINVVFAGAVKTILRHSPELDTYKVAEKIHEKFSGDVFSNEHKNSCSSIIRDGLWSALQEQASIPGNPEGFMDLAGILCNADLGLLG